VHSQHEQGIATRGTVDGRCVLQEPPASGGKAKAFLRDPPALLMPGVIGVSWLALIMFGTSTVLWTALFFWLWAVKNRVLGPLKEDGGVVTFLAVVITFALGLGWVRDSHNL